MLQTASYPFPFERSQFTGEDRIISILFSEGHLPERRAQIQRRKEFRVSHYGEALIDVGNRVCVVHRYRVQLTEISIKPNLPPFFLIMTTPQAHGDFYSSIVS